MVSRLLDLVKLISLNEDDFGPSRIEAINQQRVLLVPAPLQRREREIEVCWIEGQERIICFVYINRYPLPHNSYC